jgi:hypothetical protein
MEEKYIVGIGLIIVAIIFFLSMILVPFPANIIMMLGCFILIEIGKSQLPLPDGRGLFGDKQRKS